MKQAGHKKRLMAITSAILLILIATLIFKTPIYANESVEMPHTYTQTNVTVDQTEVVEALEGILYQLILMQQNDLVNAMLTAQQLDELRQVIGIPGTSSLRGVQIFADESATLGQQRIGARVTIRENGTLTNFIVVQHDSPSSDYIGLNNSTILLRERVLNNMQANDSHQNDYANTTLHSWLNNDYISRIDTSIRNLIRPIQIPYRPGIGGSSVVNAGTNGLETRVFIPSHTEVGLDEIMTGTPHTSIGARFAYFTSIDLCCGWCYGHITKPAQNDAGAAASWWLRAPYMIDNAYLLWFVMNDGMPIWTALTDTTTAGPRPAFALPSNLIVLPTGEVTNEMGGATNMPGDNGEGMLGLLSALIRVTEETQWRTYQALERVQQVSMWKITLTAFNAAILIVLIFAMGWRPGA